MGHLNITGASVAQVRETLPRSLRAAGRCPRWIDPVPLTLNAGTRRPSSRPRGRLAAGGLVGMPTETVYGLAADAGNASAVRSIFEAKGRPSDHPLIVHVAPAEGGDWRAAVASLAHSVPDFADALMQAFWPGPLTLILPRRPEVAAAAAGGQDSVGVRCPSHPVAQALLVAARRAHGVLGVCRAQRQPLWPRQSDDRRACG